VTMVALVPEVDKSTGSPVWDALVTWNTMLSV